MVENAKGGTFRLVTLAHFSSKVVAKRDHAETCAASIDHGYGGSLTNATIIGRR